ncbi:CIC11C00000003251 [Sungouiella intermedia]|uniref:CIC11C00000003251 n=1 Tax=Sungouiella intermedia TaxID=45354 RepID=A0A1L0B741_9ASCO|nr:CIC11C00000003251 [[Candida] intermedia]
MRPLFVSLLGITAILAADTTDYDFLYNTQLFGELELFIDRPDVLSDFAVYDTITLDSPAQTSYDAYIIHKYGSQILSIYSENGYTGTGIFGYFSLNPSALLPATTYVENETETDSSKASGGATTGSGSTTTGSSSARSGVTSETASSGDATTAGSGSTGSGSTSNAASSGSSTSAGGGAGDSNAPLLAVGAVLGALPFFLI